MMIKDANLVAYQIFEIQDQVVQRGDLIDETTFQHIQYFNYSQYKKLLFAITEGRHFYSYLINHRLHNNTNTTS